MRICCGKFLTMFCAISDHFDENVILMTQESAGSSIFPSICIQCDRRSNFDNLLFTVSIVGYGLRMTRQD